MVLQELLVNRTLDVASQRRVWEDDYYSNFVHEKYQKVFYLPFYVHDKHE